MEPNLPFRKDVIKKGINGKIRVDWKKIAEMEIDSEEGQYSGKIFSGTLIKLEKLGFLSPGPKNSYLIFTNGVPLNLDSHYFTREEDAAAYVRARYEGAEYSVKIIKWETPKILK